MVQWITKKPLLILEIFNNHPTLAQIWNSGESIRSDNFVYIQKSFSSFRSDFSSSPSECLVHSQVAFAWFFSSRALIVVVLAPSGVRRQKK